jgi:hypothetical protein
MLTGKGDFFIACLLKKSPFPGRPAGIAGNTFVSSSSLITHLKFLLFFKIIKAVHCMKKQSQKKLTLGKITVAHLSKADQQMVKGGLPRDFTKRSVCADGCCPTDINAQCRTV